MDSAEAAVDHKMKDDEEDDSRDEVGRLIDTLEIPNGSYDGAFITNRRDFLHNEVNTWWFALPYQGRLCSQLPESKCRCE